MNLSAEIRRREPEIRGAAAAQRICALRSRVPEWKFIGQRLPNEFLPRKLPGQWLPNEFVGCTRGGGVARRASSCTMVPGRLMTREFDILDDDMARVLRGMTGAERLKIANGLFNS